MKKKIAILLPFKDHFTKSQAGSASIWVKDFNKYSSYYDQITILGNTPFVNELIDKKKYRNLSLKSTTFSSKNILYVREFIKINLLQKFDLVEIHNRPSYVHQIAKTGTISREKASRKISRMTKKIKKSKK